MVYVKSNYVSNLASRLAYVFDEAAHDKSAHRVLSTVTSDNIHAWTTHGRPYRSQSGYFLSQQFKTILRRAKNPHKRQQAQHVIISFAESEFPTNDPATLHQEADQINALVAGFMAEHFNDNVPWVSGVQADGAGHKLHAHLLISSVDINGKTIPTNQFTVYSLRNQWNRYLEKHYQQVTGRVYQNPYDKPKSDPKIKQLHGWQHELQQQLATAREHSVTLEHYVATLKQQGITITQRNRSGDWSYHVTVNGKPKTVRDFYQRKDKQTGAVKSTRGIGKAYTPSSLEQYFEFKQRTKKEADTNGQQQHAGTTESTVRDDHQRPGTNTTISDELDALQREFRSINRSVEWGQRSSHQRRDTAGPSTGQ